MRIPGLKGLKHSARWLRSRFVKGALILGYHRIADVARDPYSMCVTPQHFAEQLEVLRQFAHPIRLRELICALGDGQLPKRAVVLTIDDGYADTLDQAWPLLERCRVPVTVFVTTGYLGREFWWDELAWILMPSQKGNPDPRHHLLLSLYQRLRSLASEEREQAMTQVRIWAGAESNDRPRCRALTADELIELAGKDLVEIGAHTVTHPLLVKLPMAAQRTEIQQSKFCLEELLGRPVTSFSYPNGSLSERTLAVVRESGYSCACASDNDIVWRWSRKFRLPRFWIPNWDGATFLRWLQRWLRE